MKRFLFNYKSKGIGNLYVRDLGKVYKGASYAGINLMEIRTKLTNVYVNRKASPIKFICNVPQNSQVLNKSIADDSSLVTGSFGNAS